MTSYPSSNTSFSSTTTSPSSTTSQTSPPTKPAAAAAAAAHQPPSSCRVCSGPTTGIWHYGAECCRACASFFHRSIKANRKYVCRAGQNCLINNEEGMRNSCRACRLKRCLEVGMTLDGLESSPNPMSNSSRQLRHHPPSSKSNSSSGGGGPVPHTEMFPQSLSLSLNYGGRGEGFDTSLEAKIPLTLQFESSIRQFSNGLRALSIVEGISGNLAGGENSFKSLTWEDFKRTEKGTILLIYAMIGQHLPAIANFPAASRARLCRIFAPQFSFMNKTEMTQNYLEPNSPYVMLIPGGVVDRNNLDPMMSDVHQTPEQREHFRKNFVAHFEFDCLKYRPLEITPLEFAALSAILFWNSVEFAVSEFVPAEEYGPKREALFAELNAIIEERQQRRLGCFQNGNINASSFSSSVAIRFGQLLHFLNQLGLKKSTQ